MADQICALIQACGATFTYSEGGDYPGPNCILLEVKTPRGLSVSVDFNGNSCQTDVHVLSWHMEIGRPDTLNNDTFGGNVNQYHFCKATYVAYGFEDLCLQLKKGLDLAVSGKAFHQTPRAQPVPVPLSLLPA